MWGVRQILKINEGPLGASKYSFPIMRQQIKSKFQSERISIIGKDKNLIDGILIPCKNTYNELIIKDEERKLNEKKLTEENNIINNSNDKSTSSLTSTSASTQNIRTQKNLKKSTQKSPDFPSSPLGTVLFCSPNAGLYECLSQASKDSSWVGYYTSLGFDVCLFNYRCQMML